MGRTDEEVYNRLIERIDNKDANAVCFIIQTKDETDFWWWEVSASIVSAYKGTDEEFINDENNSSCGCSLGSFKTAADAKADYES